MPRHNDTLSARRRFLLSNIGWLHSDSLHLQDLPYPHTHAALVALIARLRKILPEIPTRLLPHSDFNPRAALEYFLDRTENWTDYCNHDCKFMYFCNKSPGHADEHVEGGLCWED